MTPRAKNDVINKINQGLELNSERLIAEKRTKKQPLVVMRNNKIEYVRL